MAPGTDSSESKGVFGRLPEEAPATVGQVSGVSLQSEELVGFPHLTSA